MIGALRLNLVFWVAVFHGCVALAAAADICQAEWIAPIRRKLLSVYPLILLAAVLLFIINPVIDLTLLSLLASFLAAAAYNRAGENFKARAAVIYLLSFVIAESLIAFTCVMKLEYPWISSLFGGYFFIESMYAGIAVSGIILFFSRHDKSLRDVATLMFGFSILWAGLFYAQFLVIWYGNLPEEVVFIVKRISTPLRFSGCWLYIAALFFIPFLSLLSGRAKSSYPVVLGVSLSILAGIFIERIVFLYPVSTLNAVPVLFQFTVLLLVFVLMIVYRGRTCGE